MILLLGCMQLSRATCPASGNGLHYYGGSLITHPKVYYIWYGDWSSTTQKQQTKTILTDFATNIGATNWYKTLTTYGDCSGSVASSMSFGGSYVDSGYSQGSSSGADFYVFTLKVASYAINHGLPNDPNGIYMVFPSADVSVAGYAQPSYGGSNGIPAGGYCGFHQVGVVGANSVGLSGSTQMGSPGTISISLIGDPMTQGQATAAGMPWCQTSSSSTTPNGVAQADWMVPVVAHEIAEAITNPPVNCDSLSCGEQSHGYLSDGTVASSDGALYSGSEIADMCQFLDENNRVYNYPNTYSYAGARANIVVGSRNYLISPIWTNALGGYCAMSAPVTVTAASNGNGSISPASVLVASGAVTSFTVTPNQGYAVATVSGCGGSLNGNVFTTGIVTAGCTVTATFSPAVPTYTVTPSVSGANGSIAPSAAQTVQSGSTAQFTVTPATGYVTSVGGTCGGTLSGNIYTTSQIVANCTVVASFINVGVIASILIDDDQYTLSVSKSGSGSVSSADGGIGCGAVCSASYDEGTTVTLTATPTSGHNFTGWGGACSGTATTCVVSINNTASVTASFN
jgi:hypothetical protein